MCYVGSEDGEQGKWDSCFHVADLLVGRKIINELSYQYSFRKSLTKIK